MSEGSAKDTQFLTHYTSRSRSSCSVALAEAYEMPYALDVTTITASEARERLYRLLDEAAAGHQPVLITGKRANGVLISESDWNAVQETLHLLAVPGMRESIVEGMAAPVDECGREPGW